MFTTEIFKNKTRKENKHHSKNVYERQLMKDIH